MESIIEAMVNGMQGVPKELIVFIVSLCPFLECRGGLIAASFMGVDFFTALFF